MKDQAIIRLHFVCTITWRLIRRFKNKILFIYFTDLFNKLMYPHKTNRKHEVTKNRFKGNWHILWRI